MIFWNVFDEREGGIDVRSEETIGNVRHGGHESIWDAMMETRSMVGGEMIFWNVFGEREGGIDVGCEEMIANVRCAGHESIWDAMMETRSSVGGEMIFWRGKERSMSDGEER